MGQAGVARGMGWPRQVAALVAALAGDEPPRPRQAAAAAAVFADADRRDVLLGLIVPGLVRADALDADLVALAAPLVAGLAAVSGRVRLERAVRLVGVLPVSLAVGPLLLTAVLAWEVGDLFRAGAAVERVLELDPVNVLAGLLRFPLDAGVSLPQFRRLVRQQGSGAR